MRNTCPKIIVALLWVALSAIGLVGSGCKNPLAEEKKKPLVRELLNENLAELGRYIVYWDGKDKNGKYIEVGEYIVLLELNGYQEQDFVTAQIGGKPGFNNQGNLIPGFYDATHLETPFPDPFEILSGVNIPFTLHQPARVKLQIYAN
ncbi:hypothetical protein JW992_03410 [candidate division KSB1 bacterium]|nr:hypothetical protein [candidate division KSB1 bacterium]